MEDTRTSMIEQIKASGVQAPTMEFLHSLYSVMTAKATLLLVTLVGLIFLSYSLIFPTRSKYSLVLFK